MQFVESELLFRFFLSSAGLAAASSATSFLLASGARGRLFGAAGFVFSRHALGSYIYIDKRAGRFIKLHADEAHIALGIGLFADVRNHAIVSHAFFDGWVGCHCCRHFGSTARFAGSACAGMALSSGCGDAEREEGESQKNFFHE